MYVVFTNEFRCFHFQSKEYRPVSAQCLLRKLLHPAETSERLRFFLENAKPTTKWDQFKRHFPSITNSKCTYSPKMSRVFMFCFSRQDRSLLALASWLYKAWIKRLDPKAISSMSRLYLHSRYEASLGAKFTTSFV
jgi:hypothetical protein